MPEALEFRVGNGVHPRLPTEMLSRVPKFLHWYVLGVSW